MELQACTRIQYFPVQFISSGVHTNFRVISISYCSRKNAGLCLLFICWGGIYFYFDERAGGTCTLNCIINSIQIKLISHSLTHHAVRDRDRFPESDLNWNFVILPFQNHCTNSTQIQLQLEASFVRSFCLFCVLIRKFLIASYISTGS